MKVELFLCKLKWDSAPTPMPLPFSEIEFENDFIITFIIIIENKGRNRDFKNVCILKMFILKMFRGGPFFLPKIKDKTCFFFHFSFCVSFLATI